MPQDFSLGAAPRGQGERQSRSFVGSVTDLMMGTAQAIATLPNQLWGLIVLGIGAAMIPYATEKTLAIIGGIITAGGSLLARSSAKDEVEVEDEEEP
jgi:hypothetical protein